MRSIFEKLAVNGIDSFESYCRHKDRNFDTIESIDVESDDSIREKVESRESEDEFGLSWAIVNVDEFSVPRCKFVKFSNVLFSGDVYVGSHDLRRVEFENCIVAGRVYFDGILRDLTEVFMTWSNFHEVYIDGVVARDVRFVYCKFANFVMRNSVINFFMVQNSSIYGFVVDDNRIKRSHFDHEQINVDRVGVVYKRKALPKEIVDGLFLYDPRSVHVPSVPKGKVVQLETCDFLIKQSTLSVDVEMLARVKERVAIVSQNTWFSRLVMNCVGGFVRPGKIVVLVCLVILLFGLVYSQGFARFSIAGAVSNLCYEDALYFSAVTFFTIGYGDIVPIGIMRLVSAVEGFFGVLLMSGFVVSLVKKYVEKKN